MTSTGPTIKKRRRLRDLTSALGERRRASRKNAPPETDGNQKAPDGTESSEPERGTGNDPNRDDPETKERAKGQRRAGC